jgi:hypothetical protein
VDSFLPQLVCDALAELGVEVAQQAGAAIGQRRLDAEAVEDRGEFERDVAAADHHRALRQALERERLVGRDRVLRAGNRRHLRPGAGRHQDVFRHPAAAVDLDRVRVDEARATAQDLDAGVGEQALVYAVQPRDLPVLVGDQRRPVEPRLADRPAEIRRVMHVVAEVRRIGEELLRDAAHVDAGAAEASGLGDRDARAEAGREAGGAYAARSAADHEQIDFPRRPRGHAGPRYRLGRFNSTSSSCAFRAA